jgi:hypothetical protein
MNISELLQCKENVIVLFAPAPDIHQARVDLRKHIGDGLRAIARRAELVQKMLADNARCQKYFGSRAGRIFAKHVRELEREHDPADVSAAAALVDRLTKNGRAADLLKAMLEDPIDALLAEVQHKRAELDRIEMRSDLRFALDTPRGTLQ